MGTIELAIPKGRTGTYVPSLLRPRRRAEHALLAVVQDAYVHGVSTRKVDDLAKARGVDGISKSAVSRICAELDAAVAAFRTRPLTGEHRYLWVDATYHKVRVDGRVVSQATVVAVGITREGDRQVLGVDVGPSEGRAYWTAFLWSLVKRGLKGVRLAISDAHEGLKQGVSFPGQ
ncbi:MAG: transposase [Acidobacteria bacterium]|nr:transposase [Acidobacteriota bacterium]